MATTNLIYAVPTANSSVSYDLPANDSAKLSFAPSDIDGLKLDANGGLVISFVEGGNVTLTNFQSFIDNGNTLSLADGTEVDPKLLFNALGGEAANPFPGSDALKIGIPADGTTETVTLESGKKYLFNFDLSETQGADIKDGKMFIKFENGGQIIVDNYETAMAGEMPPELSLASKTCVVTGDELITNIQALAKSGVIDPTAEEQKEADAKGKSKVADADMEGKEDIGPGDQTKLAYKASKVEPGAGEPTAEQLANIETAAGGPAGGPRNSGYGINSRPGSDPFTGKADIGPIDPTQLGYRAPELDPSKFLQQDRDSNPNAGKPNENFLDETNLSGGPISVSDKVKINFGADGNGGITPNGSFSSSGSKTGGDLSSHGVDIVVTKTANGYVGMAGNVKVFDIVLEKMTGNYTFTQYEQLDHANGSDPNDTITLKFGFTGKDGDGDSIKTSVCVTIADDAPTISGDEKTLDESDLGPISAEGTLVHSFGQDGPGVINTSGQFAATGSVDNNVLASSGVAIVVSHTATGYVGKAGDVVVFTLDINPATGAYKYTQFKNIDHADNSDPNDIITLKFGVKIVDYDTDTATAPIIINIKDDAPGEQTCGCGGGDDDQSFGNYIETVDETNLGPVVETGTLVADFGADVPGSYAFKAGDFQSGGSKLNGQLTHQGVPVVVSIVDGMYVGKAGDVTVFTLELNASTGDYKFTLLDNLDHADGNNPNDVITLDFGVLALDYEGDSIEGNIRINVKDDAPVANDDVNTYDTNLGEATGNVITGVNGGPGAADDLSTDAANKVVKIAFGGNEIDVPATGTVSIDGQYGKLTIAADGSYTYEAFETNNNNGSGSGAAKEFVGGPALPDFDESEALDNVEKQSLGIAKGNLAVDKGDVVSVKFVAEKAGYSNTLGVFTVDANGNLKAETILVKNSDQAGSGTHTYTAGEDAQSIGFFIVANGAQVNNNYNGLDLSTGTLNFVYNYGKSGQRDAKITDDGSHVSLVFTSEGGTKTVIQGPLYFTSDRGDTSSLNPDCETRVVSGLPDQNDNTVLRIGFEDLPKLGDKDYNDMIFDVSINDKDCGCGHDDIRDQFTYTLQDGDGDRDTATLTLNGKDLIDDQPIIATPEVEIVDETNLKDGAITETGTVTVNFGSDGPGTITGNNSFTSGGSKLNGALTSGGVAVVVTYANGMYTGKAGGTTVFTMKIESNGSYAFKLFEQLDHADGNDANDIITLNFGVKATDCDNDSTDTVVTVKVKDDAPVANDDSRTVDEGQTITGNVTSNDVPGQDTPATVTKVTVNGTTYDVPNTGTINIPGTYGTLTIDKTGAYSYTANSNNPDGVDNFGYTLKDKDGDTDTAILCIDVCPKDDTPVIVKPADEIVDETNLSGGVITETGTVTANFFSDGPGTFVGNNSFASSGSRTNNALTHNGNPVVVNFAGNTYTGTANGVTIFTMTINANGSYEFKLFEQLDHADGNDANDIINLDFGVIAKDADGDSSQPTTITVKVKDDAPIAHDDHNTSQDNPATGNVITGENGGPGAADVLSQDVANKVTKVSFGGTTVDVPSTGYATIEGENGTLKIAADGSYIYTPKSGANSSGEEKTFVGGPALPDFDESEALDGVERQSLGIAQGNLSVNKGDEITIKYAGEVSAYGNSLGIFTVDANGNLKAETILIKNSDFAAGTQQTYTVGEGGQSIGFFIVANGGPVNNNYAGLDLNTGTLNFVYNYGKSGQRDAKITDDGSHVSLVFTSESGVKTVIQGPLYFTSDRGDYSNLNPDCETRVVSGLPDQNDNTVLRIGFEDLPKLGDKDYNDIIFDVSIKNEDCGCDNSDVFTYTLQDKDGDTDTATLTLDCVPGTDDQPIIAKPADEIVDETNLASGTITETGTVTANFGNDGPGSFMGNNSFTSGGSRLNNALTHNGNPVVVNFAGNTYTGTANGVTIFTMKINADGSYEFKLFEQLDHADGNDANDIITLDFGVKATDADGDNASTTITVKVKDDAPIANDDNRSTNAGQTITGNVTSNDNVGQDTPGIVTKVVFNGTTYNVPASGNTVIVGTYGTLSIDKTGAYTYVAKNAVDGQDYFTYTLKDNDGDTDPAVLCIDVNYTPEPDDTPVIVKPADEIIDETNLASGTITETGTVTANFFNDGPGTFLGNNSFTSSGSRLNNALTHNGTPVNVSFAGNTYTGTANGVTVFTMVINSNGSYTFKLFEQLDHADGNDANDIINLDFGVIAKDADGDNSQPTTITVKVKDDAPIANDDNRSTNAGQTITGNVTSNDTVGQDTPGIVTKVVFNGTTYNVPSSGNAVIVGTYGTLSIDKAGAYTYVAKNAVDGVDSFTYTLKDNDGDTDPAVLRIDVNYTPEPDDQPIIIKPADEIIDETNLASGTITETGTVTANFGNDGPGTFTGSNSFLASGSLWGGVLSSGGVAIVNSYANGVYTGKAGNTTVYTMTINSNGTYTFKLFEQLDHNDPNDANDIINLNFGVKATDADGDTATTMITVKVKDDAPIANDDTRTANAGQTITGNVTSNDTVGQDTPGIVTKVVFNNTTYNVPSSGNAVVLGTYGTLSIDKTGAYTYTAKSTANGVDNFTYTLKDLEGDTDPAVLKITTTYTQPDDTPVIVKPADELVDETNLASGTITETGKVTANFFNDGPGTFLGNNSFASSGSRTNNALTSHGVAVVVTYSNGVYTGKAGSTTVFTMTIASNGAYTFKLFKPLDHADGTNANDVINLDFGVIARDADGDNSQPTTIRVKVQDDGPYAVGEYCTVLTSTKTFSSNALSNDNFGQDGRGSLHSVTFGGQTYVVPASGMATIAGAYGTLKVSANGDYTYTINGGGPSSNKSEVFTFTIKDYDGDSASSALQVNIVAKVENGGSGNDTLNGTDGADTISGNGGDDTIYGHGGRDVIYGNTGNDTIYGGDDLDNLHGQEGDDTIYGGEGNDNIYGDFGEAETYSGNDRLFGEGGNDYIFGGRGADYIDGGEGNDALYGWDGNDTIIGGNGNDHLIGGKGNDVLTGGAGADTFWYMAINEGVDRITDFNKAQGDKLELSNVLTTFDPVTDAINNFVFATYSGGNTIISINEDGKGGASGATQIAILEGVNVNITDLFNNGNIIT